MTEREKKLTDALIEYQRLIDYLRRTTNPEEWATHGDFNKVYEQAQKALSA